MIIVLFLQNTDCLQLLIDQTRRKVLPLAGKVNHIHEKWPAQQPSQGLCEVLIGDDLGKTPQSTSDPLGTDPGKMVILVPPDLPPHVVRD